MTQEITPLLKQMLYEMRAHLTKGDIRAGVPAPSGNQTDPSLLLAQWNRLLSAIERQQGVLDQLEKDIELMAPWGEYPMQKLAQLPSQGQALRFWSVSESVFESHRATWVDDYAAEKVSQSKGKVYFTTLTPCESPITLPQAEECRIVPSPVSTLIMLQTRARDTYRKQQVQLGDFALAHYAEIEAALGLSDTLQPKHRHGFLHRLLHFFRRS